MIGEWRRAALERPWHVLTAALTLGLACGPRAPLALVAGAILLVLLTATPGRLLAGLLMLAGGAVLAEARLAALDRSPLGPQIGHALRASATLLESPRADALGWRATAGLEDDRVLIRGHGPVPRLATGDVVDVSGSLRARGPHDAWLVPRHVHAVLWAEHISASGLRRDGVAGVLDGVRRRAIAELGRGLPAPEAGLLRGMVLGDDATLPVTARTDLRRAGLGHLVAASGANVALLAVLAMAACAVLGIGLRPRLVVVLVLIAAYVPLAGGGASIRRAGVMGAATVAATLVSRPAARWHALLLAGALTLALDPASVEDPGWQLSFAAVVAIAGLSGPLRDALTRRRCPRLPAEAIALTTAATIGTAPVAAARFGVVSIAALPANLLVAPVVAPVTWLGMLAALAAQVAPAVAHVLVLTAAAPVAFITWTGHVAAALPGAAVRAPVALVTAMALAAGALVLSRAARRAACPVGVAALVAATALAGAWSAGLRGPAGRAATGSGIAFLDIGQGDATLLFDRGHGILVDTGPPAGPVVRRLRALGVHRLDALVITHAQADHDGAAPQVLAAFRVGAVLDGSDGVADAAAKALRSSRMRRVIPHAGQTLRAGTITLQVLSPGAGRTAPGDDPNTRAIVAVGTVGRLRVLLTADAESDVLGRLDLRAVDVLKVSHHGSADPGLAAVLTRLRPRLAVIEVGAHNTYGHPEASTLATLRAGGAATLRTDRDGTVVVSLSGPAIRVQRHA